MGPFLIIETGFNVIILVVWLYMVYLFFGKKKVFPKWYISAHICTLVFLIVDALALQLVRPDLPLLDPETSKAIGRSMFSVCV